MKKKRRDFLKITGLAGIGLTGSTIFDTDSLLYASSMKRSIPQQDNLSIIGRYGSWASSLNEGKIPTHSFRRSEWSDLETWKKAATDRWVERLGIRDLGPVPKATLNKQYDYDGLHIEEISWQLPYGPPTEAILLKPRHAQGPLPGILAFHDHGGNKYFGKRKITRTDKEQHPLMIPHQENYYEGTAWANELAKRGYVVLVWDAFPFASRRVNIQDVPERLRQGLDDSDPENPENIKAYNRWAADHEDIMAKSLFSAGTTWPGVFFAEDQKALDILCAREDVDANRIGCGCLSGWLSN